MSPRKLFDELNVRNFGTFWPRNRLLRVPEPRWGLGSFREIGGSLFRRAASSTLTGVAGCGTLWVDSTATDPFMARPFRVRLRRPSFNPLYPRSRVRDGNPERGTQPLPARLVVSPRRVGI